MSTQLDISNQGTGPALKVTQAGSGDSNSVALFNAGSEGDALLINSVGNITMYKNVDICGTLNVNNRNISSSLNTIDSSFVSVASSLSTIDSSFVSVASSLSTIDSSFVSISTKITTIDSSFVSVASSLSTIDSSFVSVASSLDNKQNIINSTSDISMLNLDISGSLHVDNSLIIQNLDVYQKIIDLSNNGSGSGSITIDSALSSSSNNTLRNSVITNALSNKQATIDSTSDISMLNLDISGSLHIDNSLIVQNLDVYQKLIDLSNNGTNGGSGSGIFTQSGSIYYYDSTSLGIGTSDVSENYALTISGGLYLTGTSSLSYITPSWLNDASSNLYIEDINTLGIGTNYNDLSFDNQLDVSGNVYFRNNLNVDNILMLNGINVYNKLNESNIDSTTDISVNHLDVSGTLKVQNLDIYQKVIDLSNNSSSGGGGLTGLYSGTIQSELNIGTTTSYKPNFGSTNIYIDSNYFSYVTVSTGTNQGLLIKVAGYYEINYTFAFHNDQYGNRLGYRVMPAKCVNSTSTNIPYGWSYGYSRANGFIGEASCTGNLLLNVSTSDVNNNIYIYFITLFTLNGNLYDDNASNSNLINSSVVVKYLGT
jgi:transcription elongation factor Elf1